MKPAKGGKRVLKMSMVYIIRKIKSTIFNINIRGIELCKRISPSVQPKAAEFHPKTRHPSEYLSSTITIESIRMLGKKKTFPIYISPTEKSYKMTYSYSDIFNGITIP